MKVITWYDVDTYTKPTDCSTRSLKLSVNRNLNSHIDLHTQAGSTFDNCMTFIFDLFDLRFNACRGPAMDYCILYNTASL